MLGTQCLFSVQKPQNHGMVWTGRDIKDHLVPALLPWAGTSSTQELVQAGHEHFQEWSRDYSSITLKNIIAALRTCLGERIALGSSGGFSRGFLGFSACSCGPGTLTCPGCSIHAAKLLVNFLWNKIFRGLLIKSIIFFACFSLTCSISPGCVLGAVMIKLENEFWWHCRSAPSHWVLLLKVSLMCWPCCRFGQLVYDENQLCRSCHSINSSMLFSL